MKSSKDATDNIVQEDVTRLVKSFDSQDSAEKERLFALDKIRQQNRLKQLR